MWRWRQWTRQLTRWAGWCSPQTSWMSACVTLSPALPYTYSPRTGHVTHSYKRLVATCHSFWFIVFCCTWYRNRRNNLLLHGCCRLEETGSRIEAGLQGERCGCMWVLRSKSVEELPLPSVPNGTRTYAPLQAMPFSSIQRLKTPILQCNKQEIYKQDYPLILLSVRSNLAVRSL